MLKAQLIDPHRVERRGRREPSEVRPKTYVALEIERQVRAQRMERRRGLGARAKVGRRVQQMPHVMSASVARIAALGQVHREPIALGPHRIQDARRIQTTCIDDDAREQRIRLGMRRIMRSELNDPSLL